MLQKLQKLYSLARNPSAGNKLPAQFLKNLFAWAIYCLHAKYSKPPLIVKSCKSCEIETLSFALLKSGSQFKFCLKKQPLKGIYSLKKSSLLQVNVDIFIDFIILEEHFKMILLSQAPYYF